MALLVLPNLSKKDGTRTLLLLFLTPVIGQKASKVERLVRWRKPKGNAFQLSPLSMLLSLSRTHSMLQGMLNLIQTTFISSPTLGKRNYLMELFSLIIESSTRKKSIQEYLLEKPNLKQTNLFSKNLLKYNLPR